MKHYTSVLGHLLLAAVTSCAWVDDMSSMRIIGGDKAVLGQFPFMAYLLSIAPENARACSASIISRNWIITAAHCTQVPDPGYVVVAGVLNPADYKLGQGRKVTHIIDHPQYAISQGLQTFDISLLQVTEPFEWNEFVKPIHLASTFINYEVGKCNIVGFGHTKLEAPGGDPTELYYLTIKDKVEPCTQKEVSSLFPFEYTEHHLCSAGGPWGVQHMYLGDSGGPLVCDDVQIGIASMVATDLSEITLQIHTSVAHFYQWITEHVSLDEG